MLASLLVNLAGIGHEPNNGDATIVFIMARRPIALIKSFIAALAFELADIKNGGNPAFSGKWILNCPKLSETAGALGAAKYQYFAIGDFYLKERQTSKDR